MNHDNTAESWYRFIKYGEIGDAVRPEIKRSWERSRQRKLNPYKIKPMYISDSLLEKRLSKNEGLVAIAKPILAYLHAISARTCITFCDKDGYGLFKVHQSEFWNAVGVNLSEEAVGTTACGIALKDNIAFETGFYENYAVVYHTHHCTAAPIRDENQQVVGMVSMFNPYGKRLPEDAFELTKLAALLVEDQLNAPIPSVLEETEEFQSLINKTDHGVLILNEFGDILAMNDETARAFSTIGYHEKMVGGKIRDYFPNVKKPLYASSEEFRMDNKQTEVFANYTLVDRMNVQTLSGETNTIYLFRPDGENKCTHRHQSDSQADCVDKVIVGISDEWQAIKKVVRKVSKINSAKILIDGESGTGKEVVAKAIHRFSERKGNFIAVNCGSIPYELLQSELFGYVDGAFTGAKRGGNPGKFELANKGTLFLDEIGEMPLNMQVSLLRFLEDKVIFRIGSSKPVFVDTTIIAATNRNLQDAIVQGSFRTDLYYRLNVIKMSLPPLRNRKEDIPVLTEHLIELLSKQLDIPPITVSAEVLHTLMQYNWPGNVRELRNFIEKALIFSESGTISAEQISGLLLEQQLAAENVGEEPGMLSLQKAHIMNVLGKNAGNISLTARELGLSRNTVYKYIDKYNLYLYRNR
jgi:Transcriptional activator of acetoin/glycerol metabolism